MHFINILNIFYLKYLIPTLLVLLTSLNVAAQINSEEIFLTEEELSWIADHSIITAVSNTSFAPFDFVSAGEPVGLSIDYLNLLTSKVGLKVEYVNYGGFYENITMGMEGKIDVIHTLSKTEERQKYFTFSDPYIIDTLALYGRSGSGKINTITDLTNKRIGVIKGHFISISYMSKYPNFNYVEFNNNRDALRALIANEIDVFPYETMTTEFAINQTNIQGIEIIGNDFIIDNSEIDQRLGINNNKPILMNIINKAIASVREEEFAAISDKWLTVDQPIKNIGLTPEELEWLAHNKKISVAAALNDTPYEYINSEGKISGITGDYLNEISERLGIEFEWGKNTSWNDALLKYDKREIDIISYITPTKERQRNFNFTKPYLTVNQAIFTLKEGQIFPNIESLKGYSIALEKNTAIIEYLQRDYPEITVIETDDRDGLTELLLAGEVDAFIGDITLFNSLFGRMEIDNVIATGFSEYTIENAFGVHPDLPLLYSSMEKAMADISPFERQVILDKILSYNITPKIDYGPLYYVVSLSVLGGIAVLIWNRSLIRRRKEAEQANEAKSSFLASMSHDLRTPLNAIIGFSETISKETFGPINNEKYVDYIKDINASGEYLLHLVDDILDLSALEAGQRKLNYENFDSRQLILECKNIVFKLANDKNIDIAINSSEKIPTVCADRSALKQILMNLISNAIKFTPPNGSITVNSNASDKNYIFQISDTGRGIAQEDLKTITKPFTKVQSSPFISHEQGTGLGLSIVKSLVILHAGKISIESILGEGTTVTISIPR